MYVHAGICLSALVVNANTAHADICVDINNNICSYQQIMYKHVHAPTVICRCQRMLVSTNTAHTEIPTTYIRADIRWYQRICIQV